MLSTISNNSLKLLNQLYVQMGGIIAATGLHLALI
jgi:hypothetical protein